MLCSFTTQELRPLASLLAEGTARVFSGGDTPQLKFSPAARLGALECALDAAKRDAAAHGPALRSCRRTLPALLSALRAAAASAPERRRREFSGGAELVFRDFARAPEEQQEAALAALKLIELLASGAGEAASPEQDASPKGAKQGAGAGPRPGSAIAFAAALDASEDGWVLIVPMLESPRTALAAQTVRAEYCALLLFFLFVC